MRGVVAPLIFCGSLYFKYKVVVFVFFCCCVPSSWPDWFFFATCLCSINPSLLICTQHCVILLVADILVLSVFVFFQNYIHTLLVCLRVDKTVLKVVISFN